MDKENIIKNEESNLIKLLKYQNSNPITIIEDLFTSLKEKINSYNKQLQKLIDDNSLKIDNNPVNSENSLTNTCQKTEIDFENNLNKEREQKIISLLNEIKQILKNQNNELNKQIEDFLNILKIYKQQVNEFKKSEKYNIENNSKYEIDSLKKELNELKSKEKIRENKREIRKKEIKKDDKLPDIREYFITKGKFQLVSTDGYLYHMRKCHKFGDFKKKFSIANISKDKKDIILEFINTYNVFEEEEEEEEGTLKKEKEIKEEADKENSNKVDI